MSHVACVEEHGAGGSSLQRPDSVPDGEDGGMAPALEGSTKPEKKPTQTYSQYRGVSHVPRSGRWRTTFKHKTDRYCLGTFATAEGAARVWDLAAIKCRGIDTQLNFERVSYQRERELLERHTLEEVLDMLNVRAIDAPRTGRAVKRKLDAALQAERGGGGAGPSAAVGFRAEPRPSGAAGRRGRDSGAHSSAARGGKPSRSSAPQNRARCATAKRSKPSWSAPTRVKSLPALAHLQTDTSAPEAEADRPADSGPGSCPAAGAARQAPVKADQAASTPFDMDMWPMDSADHDPFAPWPPRPPSGCVSAGLPSSPFGSSPVPAGPLASAGSMPAQPKGTCSDVFKALASSSDPFSAAQRTVMPFSAPFGAHDDAALLHQSLLASAGSLSSPAAPPRFAAFAHPPPADAPCPALSTSAPTSFLSGLSPAMWRVPEQSDPGAMRDVDMVARRVEQHVSLGAAPPAAWTGVKADSCGANAVVKRESAGASVAALAHCGPSWPGALRREACLAQEAPKLRSWAPASADGAAPGAEPVQGRLKVETLLAGDFRGWDGAAPALRSDGRLARTTSLDDLRLSRRAGGVKPRRTDSVPERYASWSSQDQELPTPPALECVAEAPPPAAEEAAPANAAPATAKAAETAEGSKPADSATPEAPPPPAGDPGVALRMQTWRRMTAWKQPELLAASRDDMWLPSSLPAPQHPPCALSLDDMGVPCRLTTARPRASLGPVAAAAAPEEPSAAADAAWGSPPDKTPLPEGLPVLEEASTDFVDGLWRLLASDLPPLPPPRDAAAGERTAAAAVSMDDSFFELQQRSALNALDRDQQVRTQDDLDLCDLTRSQSFFALPGIDRSVADSLASLEGLTDAARKALVDAADEADSPQRDAPPDKERPAAASPPPGGSWLASAAAAAAPPPRSMRELVAADSQRGQRGHWLGDALHDPTFPLCDNSNVAMWLNMPLVPLPPGARCHDDCVRLRHKSGSPAAAAIGRRLSSMSSPLRPRDAPARDADWCLSSPAQSAEVHGERLSMKTVSWQGAGRATPPVSRFSCSSLSPTLPPDAKSCAADAPAWRLRAPSSSSPGDEGAATRRDDDRCALGLRGVQELKRPAGRASRARGHRKASSVLCERPPQPPPVRHSFSACPEEREADRPRVHAQDDLLLLPPRHDGGWD